MKADDIQYTYTAKHDPDGNGFHAAVPRRNLTKAEVDALPKFLQDQLKQQPMYEKVVATKQAADKKEG